MAARTGTSSRRRRRQHFASSSSSTRNKTPPPPEPHSGESAALCSSDRRTNRHARGLNALALWPGRCAARQTRTRTHCDSARNVSQHNWLPLQPPARPGLPQRQAHTLNLSSGSREAVGLEHAPTVRLRRRRSPPNADSEPRPGQARTRSCSVAHLLRNTFLAAASPRDLARIV